MSNKLILSIPASPKSGELNDIKQRQLDRKTYGMPIEVTNEYMYQMLYDILENQARHENKLNAIIEKLGIGNA